MIPRTLFFMRVLLLYLLLASTGIFAGTCDETFTQLFYSSYRPGCCYENIWNFTRSLSEKQVDLSHAKVILLFIPEETLVALDTRDAWKEWKFHLVLENEGVIYDFDFTPTPAPLDFGTYFESMFKAKSDAWGLDKQPDKIRVYELKAEDYFQRYQNADLGRPTIDYDSLHQEAQRKASLSLNEYLKSKLNRAPNNGFWIPFTSSAL